MHDHCEAPCADVISILARNSRKLGKRQPDFISIVAVRRIMGNEVHASPYYCYTLIQPRVSIL